MSTLGIEDRAEGFALTNPERNDMITNTRQEQEPDDGQTVRQVIDDGNRRLLVQGMASLRHSAPVMVMAYSGPMPSVALTIAEAQALRDALDTVIEAVR